jgi:ubiquinone biosynthesis protein
MSTERAEQTWKPPLDEQLSAPVEDVEQRSPEVDSLPPSSLRRAREIASVLRRHGLWNLVEAFGLKRHLPFQRSRRQDGVDSASMDPAQFRMALEELGPTFMKLGQVLSTRSDLLPPGYLAELARLQDAAPEVPAEKVSRILEVELGRPVSEVFTDFDSRPLATGSIGQAHLATLADGTEVVVKVRRPEAVAQIEEDLHLLHRLAGFASRHWDAAKDYDVVALVKEFDNTLHGELDYALEASHTERFASNFESSPAVHIPRVFWESTTGRVLTLERMRGIRVTDAAAVQDAGIDRSRLARAATGVFMKMIFEDGFFHADPHPGNLFVESEERIGLIDFGMVGSVDDGTREGLALLIVGVFGGDSDRVVDALLALGVTGPHVDRSALKRDLHPKIQLYKAGATGAGLSPILADVMDIVRRHHLVVPGNLSLLVKAVATGEGTTLQLDPNFQLIDAMAPHARRLVLQMNSPEAWARRVGHAAPDMAWLGTEAPGALRRLLNQLETGSVRVDVQPKGLEPSLRRLEGIANRLVLGMIVAALIVGLGVSASVYHPGVAIPGLGLFVTVGLALAAALGIALAWSVFRSSR